MPYKDLEKRRDAVRKSRAKGREIPSETPPPETPREIPPDTEGLETPNGHEIPLEIPNEVAWQAVKDFILRPSNNPKMTNLEKLQAISQSLGRYADDVWFGTGGLTMGDIGRVLSV